MWICTNNAYVSIVEDRYDENFVFVRGRREIDVKNFTSSDRPIHHTPDADYQYRTRISKNELVNILITLPSKVTYDNFKASVKDDALQRTYHEFWCSSINNLDPDWSNRKWLTKK